MKRLFIPIALVISLLTFGFGQSSQSLEVIPTITDADIINAAVLVDPFAEKIKDIAPTSFSLNILNTSNPRAEVKAHM